MPCRDAGVPVMIDMLFGHVKLGIEPSATTLNPCWMNRATAGIEPSPRNCRKYAGSPPSMQTTTTGCRGHRYWMPFASTKGLLDVMLSRSYRSGVSDSLRCFAHGLRIRGRRLLERALQALAAADHMVVEQALGELLVAFRHRGHDRLVIARRNRNVVSGARERRPAIQVQLADDAPIIREKRGVPRGLRQRVVEFQVQREIGIRIARAGDRLHALDQRAQPAQLCRLRTLRRQAPNHRLQRRADLVDLARLGQRDLSHVDTAVLFGPHQPDLLQRAERFAHRPTRNPQVRGYVGLVELRSRRQLTRFDLPLELALNEAGERLLA